MSAACPLRGTRCLLMALASWTSLGASTASLAAQPAAVFALIGAPSARDTEIMNALQLELRATEPQKATAGLRVALSIHNSGERPLVVRDVHDSCRLEAFDDAGWPVSPPPTPSRLFVHSKAPHDDVTIRATATEEMAFTLPQALANPGPVYADAAAPLSKAFSAGAYRVRMYCTLLVGAASGSRFDAVALRSELVTITLSN